MKNFESVFGFPPECHTSAPGRVNLLGEHTDYNEGWVLPTIIPQRTHVMLAESPKGSDLFYSKQTAAGGDAGAANFPLYLTGCIASLRAKGHALPALAIYVDSSVPIGAGLSSSAALEVALLRALRERFALPLTDIEIAQIAQAAEASVVGVRCGIMDQMASSLGTLGCVLALDTRTLAWSLTPLPAEASIVVLDSGVRRSLSNSAYNARRAECEQAAQLLGIQALRDVSDISALTDLPAALERRARHVVTENARVRSITAAITARDLGELMNASHESLRQDFEVSIPAMDRLVWALQRHADVFGAKLTGAGFGGACVALVRQGGEEAVSNQVLSEYRASGDAGARLV